MGGILRCISLNGSAADLTIKLYRYKIISRGGGSCDCISSANFINLTANGTFSYFIGFTQRAVCVEETVVSSDKDARSLHSIDDNTQNVGNFLHSILTSLKHLLFWGAVYVRLCDSCCRLE